MPGQRTSQECKNFQRAAGGHQGNRMNADVMFSSPFKGVVGRGMGLKMKDFVFRLSLYYPIPNRIHATPPPSG